MKRDGGKGLTIEQLCDRCGVWPRTVLHWTREGLFDPPPFRGAQTRYGDEHVARLQWIVRLREEGYSLKEIRRELARAPSAPPPEPPPPPAQAPAPAPQGVAAPAPAPSIAAPPATEQPPVEPPPRAREPSTRWDRFVLFPGVELLVSATIGPFERRMVDEILSKYRSGSTD